MTASNVPRWTMTVKSMSLGRFIRADTSVRWPDEDTGRNSVSPCTMPRSMPCIRVIYFHLGISFLTTLFYHTLHHFLKPFSTQKPTSGRI